MEPLDYIKASMDYFSFERNSNKQSFFPLSGMPSTFCDNSKEKGTLSVITELSKDPNSVKSQSIGSLHFNEENKENNGIPLEKCYKNLSSRPYDWIVPLLENNCKENIDTNITKEEKDACNDALDEFDTLCMGPNLDYFVPKKITFFNQLTKSLVEVTNDNFEIANGGFSIVILGHDLNNIKYAIKIMKKTEAPHASVANEVKAGIMLNHKGIVQLFGYTDDKFYHYLFFEYLEDYKELFYFVEECKECESSDYNVRFIVKQLAEILLYCHNNNIVHMDVKFDNIMIHPETYKIKLIDFGLCDFITESNDTLTKMCGSREYCPVEFIERPKQPYSAKKADTWCLGVVMYCLLTTSFPFEPKSRMKSLGKSDCHPPLVLEVDIGLHASNLLYKILEFDPTKRIYLTDVLEHPWIKAVKC